MQSRIYSNYECGDVDIPTSVLIKLAEFHKTSIDYLLELTDEKRTFLIPERKVRGKKQPRYEI